MLISSSCPQPQLGLPLVRLLSKALTPLFDRLLNGLVSARKKKLWRFMTFEFFILTQVLDSGCPICFLELTLGNYILQVAFFHLINVLSKLSLYDLNTIHILATRMLERPEGE